MKKIIRPKRRFTLLIGILAILTGLIFVCGCTQQPAGPGAPTPKLTQVPGEGLVSFDEKDNGKTVTVSPGESFFIRLKENPTTGYSWNATWTTGLEALGEGYEPDPGTAGLAGAGGIHYWIFKGTEIGMQQFSAGYARPWENETPPESTYSLHISVGEVLTPPVSPEKDIPQYGESDNGSTVDAATGSMLRVVLDENPTTGYVWNATLTQGLFLVNDTYEVNPHSEGMVGVGGKHSWLIRADDPGEQEFNAVYGRPWENATPEDAAYSLKIMVRNP
jgi:inhibitor of cysteine peptidase